SYLAKLGEAADIDIYSYQALLDALRKRHDYFHAAGGRLSDHGISTFYAVNFKQGRLDDIFAKLRAGNNVSPEEAQQFKSGTLHAICEWNHEKGWTQQFHVGAIRNNNSRLVSLLGADAGVDSIGDWQVAEGMSAFLDGLDKKNKLARTIVYNLNPA